MVEGSSSDFASRHKLSEARTARASGMTLPRTQVMNSLDNIRRPRVPMPIKTIREESLGNLTLRLLETNGGFSGVILGGPKGRIGPITGASEDEVWCRLHAEAGKTDHSYFGFDGARTRFLQYFPRGFADPGYAKAERNYKMEAKQKLDTTAPLAEAATGSGLGEAILRVFQATNLLSPFETIRLQELLHGKSADAFVRAAAQFALGAGVPALLDMERLLRPHDNAKWTVVTYLPFLWRPEAHMFLKPHVTRDFAARVGHRFRFDYEPRLEIGVYDSLLDLARQTELELAELHPRDRIDVQSFIWVCSFHRR